MADDIVLGAKQLKSNVKPKLDTDAPDTPDNFMGTMDTSNPPKNTFVPEPHDLHPMEHHFNNHGVRHPLGRGMPKQLPNAKISEN